MKNPKLSTMSQSGLFLIVLTLSSSVLETKSSSNVIDMNVDDNTNANLIVTDDNSARIVTDLNLTFRGDYLRAKIHSHKKVVVCYVGTWSTYRQPAEGAFNLDNIEPELCTHLIYSFAGLDNTTFTMKPLDPWLDQHLQENGGGRDWYTKFNDFKKTYPHLKVLLAIGGWNEGSKKYSEMAAEPTYRESFIQSALDLIRRYGFDGIDLDWEFPADRGGKPEDKRHFTLLVQELRHKFDKYGLMITSAFGPAKTTAEKGYELRELAALLDHVHLMCYDYHGAWDSKADHNAPLYAPPDEGSIQASVDYYIQQGVPPHKLVLGFPFYGRTFLLRPEQNVELGPRSAKHIAGLHQPAGNKGFQGPYTKEDGFLGYNEICRELVANRGDWVTYWDDNAKVPYMRNMDKWVSFDNPDSITEKVKFLIKNRLRGALIWSIDTDDIRGSCGIRNPLLRTINYQLYKNAIPGDDIPVSPTARPPLRPTAAGEILSSSFSFLCLMVTATILSKLFS